MYKEVLALNNLQWLICIKIKPNQSFPQHGKKNDTITLNN